MPKILSRAQVGLLAALYAAAAVFSALLILKRYLVYAHNPQDASAAGGMYACGDMLLVLIVVCLFLAPTAVLVFFLCKWESAYFAYARILFGISLTAPLAFLLMFVPAVNQAPLGAVALFRLFAIPILAIVCIVSLLLARSPRARRLIAWALLLEALPFAAAIGYFAFFTLRR